MRPIIGLTANHSQNRVDQLIIDQTEAYAAAILAAGGVPVLIPSILAAGGWETLYPHLNGILFCGGPDIGVEQYGGTNHARNDEPDNQRDALELSLLHRAISDRMAFLGICRGCQLINIGYGGTLYTHIAAQLDNPIEHDFPEGETQVLRHKVHIGPGTRLAASLGALVLRVNSHHHQGVRSLGTGLLVAARAPDGLVEAIEVEDYPFGVAVQWHPEWLTNQDSARQLFAEFVRATDAH